MADKKISAMTAKTAIVAGDIVPILDSEAANVNKKGTVANLIKGMDHGDLGTKGDGSDHSFIDQDVTSGSSPTFDAANITGTVTGTVEILHIDVRKGSVGSIAVGTPVYMSGYNVGGWYEVEAADAANAAKMPAIGMANVAITNAATVKVVNGGELTGLDTTPGSPAVNDPIYVASGGGWTATKPTGTNLIQKIGLVARAHGSQGVIEITGAGRSNDVPNIPDNQVWIGNGSGVATPTDFDTLLATGVSGGRTLQSGTASGEDLTIQTTAHATKGMVEIDGVAAVGGYVDVVTLARVGVDLSNEFNRSISIDADGQMSLNAPSGKGIFFKTAGSSVFRVVATTKDFEVFKNGGTTALYVKESNGYVGILKNNPGTALDVAGTVTATGLAMTNTVTEFSTDGTLAGDSDSAIPTEKAVKTYADALLAANDAMTYKGATDCSTNPNYPAADAGDTYKVSVAGKIGGASGVVVEIGDMYICLVDSSPGGDQAAVGTDWNVLQANVDGAVIGPASSTDNAITRYDGTTGKLVQNSAGTISDAGLLAGVTNTNWDAAKTHADGDGSDHADVATNTTHSSGDGTDHSAVANNRLRVKTIQIDGNGFAIATGQVKGYFSLPVGATITKVRMLADQSTTTTIDIWKDTYANFPPTDADSITASAVPTITAALKSEDSTLTGWTTAVTSGDIFALNVDANNNAEHITLELFYTVAAS